MLQFPNHKNVKNLNMFLRSLNLAVFCLRLVHVSLCKTAPLVSFNAGRTQKQHQNYVTLRASSPFEATNFSTCFRVMPRYSTAYMLFYSEHVEFTIDNLISNSFGFLKATPQMSRVFASMGLSPKPGKWINFCWSAENKRIEQHVRLYMDGFSRLDHTYRDSDTFDSIRIDNQFTLGTSNEGAIMYAHGKVTDFNM